MSAAADTPASGEGEVTVRYWASVRAAQGRASEQVDVPAGGFTVADLLRRITEGREPRVAQVVAACSLLLDETAVHADRVGETDVRPGAVVDLLPPFAGGAI